MSTSDMDVIFLKGSKIILRPVISEDAGFFNTALNDPVIRDSLFIGLPTTVELQEEKIRKHINSGETILFTILDTNSGSAVGQTGFFRIDYINRNAVFFVAILDTDYWSLGFGTETTQMMLDYAFNTMNLNRIQLHVFSGNDPAIRIYKKTGFKKEGVLRQAMFRQGKYHDFWVMSILKKEWSRRQKTA